MFATVLMKDNWQEKENSICGFGNTTMARYLKKTALH
jgi:hypothetical protein